MVARKAGSATAPATGEPNSTVLSLQVLSSQGKVAPLSRLRGRRRPLILAGARGFVNKGLRAAEKRKKELQERGVARALLSVGYLPASFLLGYGVGGVPRFEKIWDACGACAVRRVLRQQ